MLSFPRWWELPEVHLYTAYGLCIHSELPLPELVASEHNRSDVTVRRGTVSVPDGAVPDSYFAVSEMESGFYWKSIGSFLVRDGNQVIVDALPGVEERLVRLPLLGTVLAALLRQRGLLVLHGSAVECDGSAVVFLGHSGYGKSTMAAILYRRGHHLLADDVVAVDLKQPILPNVLPSFPQLKLHQASATAALGEGPERLTRLASDMDKFARSAREQFWAAPLPLGAVYLLSIGDCIEATALTAQQSLTQLLTFSVSSLSPDQPFQGRSPKEHFKQCAELVNRVPVRQLKRPVALEALPQVADFVEEDIRRFGQHDCVTATASL